MSYISMKSLLEAGVHFGHQTKRWNPKMAKYIFGSRNGIYILDLQKTVQCFNQAYELIREVARNGGNCIFVGTKKQAHDAIKEAAVKSGSYYINHRWQGGLLTNFETIKGRVVRLKQLEEMFNTGYVERFTKKEGSLLKKEYDKLERNLGGIKEMKELPDLMFIIDIKVEIGAVREARKLGIPIVAIVDTNCDPDLVDFPIPGNDDAIRACQLISQRVSDAINEGKQIREEELIASIEEAGQQDETNDVPDEEIVAPLNDTVEEEKNNG